MSNEYSMHLDLCIQPKLRGELLTALAFVKHPKTELDYFKSYIGVSSNETIEFRPGQDDTYRWPECPDDEGFVTTMVGKWKDPEQIVNWIAHFCSQGRIILHSLEADADAFGWEIKKGKYRYLGFKPIGVWKSAKPSTLHSKGSKINS